MILNRNPVLLIPNSSLSHQAFHNQVSKTIPQMETGYGRSCKTKEMPLSLLLISCSWRTANPRALQCWTAITSAGRWRYTSRQVFRISSSAKLVPIHPWYPVLNTTDTQKIGGGHITQPSTATFLVLAHPPGHLTRDDLSALPDDVNMIDLIRAESDPTRAVISYDWIEECMKKGRRLESDGFLCFLPEL